MLLLLVAAMVLLVQPALGATSITINFGGLTTVYPGQSNTTTITFLSDGVAVDPSSKSIVHQHPSGTQDFTSQFAKISTGIYRWTSTMSTDAVPGQRTYHVTGTISGTYTTASASYNVACPSLSAAIEHDKSTYLVGDNVYRTVRYYRDGSPADPLSQTVTTLLPTGSTSTATMTKSSTGVYTTSGVAGSEGQRTVTATATISGSQCSVEKTATYNVVSSLPSPTPTPTPSGLGTPIAAPQVSLRLVSATTSSITVEHQGGDSISFKDVSARVGGVPYSLEGLTGITLSAGQKMEIQFGFNVVKSGSTASLIHTPTGQTIASFLVYLSTPTPVVTPTPFTTAVGSPCALGVVVRSDRTQVERDELARLTATVSNSGDEACTGTTLSSMVNPSAGATVTWDATSVTVPGKGSVDVMGTFSASASGAYTVTVKATRGTVAADGSATIGVAAAPTPAPTPTPTPTPMCSGGQPQGAKRCSGNFLQQCSADYSWRNLEECPYGCSNGACNAPPASTPTPPAAVAVDINVSGAVPTPGFEALSAIAALGLLALVLRKRR